MELGHLIAALKGEKTGSKMSSESATNGVHYNHNKRDLITQILTNDGSKDDFKKVVNKVLKELLFYFT